MNLTIDFEGRANKIQRELFISFFMEKFITLSRFKGIKSWILNKERLLGIKLIKSLNEFILTLEGLQGHIFGLPLDVATSLHSDIKKAVQIYDMLDEKAAKIDYFHSPHVKERLKCTLKTLYKTEALLYKAIMKDIPVEPTSDYIKNGINKLSQEAILKSLQ